MSSQLFVHSSDSPSSSVVAISPETPLIRVVITGALWPLGRRVVQLLRTHGGYVVSEVERGQGVIDQPVDILVHLAPGDHDALAARGRSAVVGTPELLDAASHYGATHVVLLSSAMVYGAWPNNPVPLTEDTALRPDSRFAFARQLATVEQLVDDWRDSKVGRTTCVLRPVPAMAVDGTSGLVRALAAGMGSRLSEDDIPAQFLHLDDLASAVMLVIEKKLDGVYNVAPDGYVPGSRVRSLWGMAPRVKLPERLHEVVADLRWRFQRGPIPPGLRPYVRSPWLVSNGRLRAQGWSPTVTNEQTFVEGTHAKWWTMLTPKRKQEISLTALVVIIIGGVASALIALQRYRHRR